MVVNVGKTTKDKFGASAAMEHTVEADGAVENNYMKRKLKIFVKNEQIVLNTQDGRCSSSKPIRETPFIENM